MVCCIDNGEIPVMLGKMTQADVTASAGGQGSAYCFISILDRPLHIYIYIAQSSVRKAASGEHADKRHESRALRW